MSAPQPNGEQRVSFTVKELLIDLKADIRGIAAALETKTDSSETAQIWAEITRIKMAAVDLEDYKTLRNNVEYARSTLTYYKGALAALAAVVLPIAFYVVRSALG